MSGVILTSHQLKMQAGRETGEVVQKLANPLILMPPNKVNCHGGRAESQDNTGRDLNEQLGKKKIQTKAGNGWRRDGV